MLTVQCSCYEVRPLVPGGECQIRESAALIHGLQLVWRSFSRIGIEASSTAARGKEEKFSGLPVRTVNIQGGWFGKIRNEFIFVHRSTIQDLKIE